MIRPAFFPGPRSPLLQDTAGTVAHAYWKGGRLVDTRGSAWTMNGTVPQVPKAGRTPAGAGPYSAANNYSLANPNALQFAGDFSFAFVFSLTSVAGIQRLVDVGNDATNGWSCFNNGGPLVMQFNNATVLGTQSAAVTAGVVNVAYGGRVGGNAALKLNLGAFNSAAAAYTASASPARLGSDNSAAGQVLAGTLYEAWFSTATPTDALGVSIISRVKSRAGITAW